MIIVDSIIKYPASMTTEKGLPGPWWAHLTSNIAGDDGRAELLAFAKRIGLNLAWRQKWDTTGFHFDLTRSMRYRAIQAGAQPVEARAMWEKRFTSQAEADAAAKAKRQETRPVFGTAT